MDKGCNGGYPPAQDLRWRQACGSSYVCRGIKPSGIGSCRWVCDSRRFGGSQCLSSTLQSRNPNWHYIQEELNPQTYVVHYRVHNSTPLVPTASQINPSESSKSFFNTYPGNNPIAVNKYYYIIINIKVNKTQAYIWFSGIINMAENNLNSTLPSTACFLL